MDANMDNSMSESSGWSSSDDSDIEELLEDDSEKLSKGMARNVLRQKSVMLPLCLRPWHRRTYGFGMYFLGCPEHSMTSMCFKGLLCLQD